jgi:hypothetical protein
MQVSPEQMEQTFPVTLRTFLVIDTARRKREAFDPGVDAALCDDPRDFVEYLGGNVVIMLRTGEIELALDVGSRKLRRRTVRVKPVAVHQTFLVLISMAFACTFDPLFVLLERLVERFPRLRSARAE